MRTSVAELMMIIKMILILAAAVLQSVLLKSMVTTAAEKLVNVPYRLRTSDGFLLEGDDSRPRPQQR